ncbi:WecB/TagA/CpsF family glycosyltransferase [Marinobacter nanhaiticus D15-8W]|uniref:Glycosyltransferase n=1 Tax=Marinobacter nanhaiticus D15-8W TaxID=626887 RepID=N6WTG6_9GAMM|nr:WecB/TagA/CpsF family glycosyltransferase [Marinobacter nanhaiticus]ENO14786.1 glycosyltransferase [Marinobacter nanhaiticus D15-8W]BES69525.1 WecB/TagA/CpsF family glycosyltransferase [Marinobacter nanhaiticus D15-8W]
MTAVGDEMLPLGGLNVKALTFDGLVQRIYTDVDAGRQVALFYVNSNLINKCEPIRDALNGPDVIMVNDGIAMDLASWLVHRRRYPENLNGTDFTPALLAENANSSDQPWRVFLYGSKPGIAEQAAEKLRESNVQVVGTCDGYNRDSDAIIGEMNASGANVVLVAMGNPLQEQWILEHRDRLDARLLIGVGALLDFLAGDKPRAPLLIRRMRLEWAYRLSLEPTRLLRRYTLDMLIFLARCSRHRPAKLERPSG